MTMVLKFQAKICPYLLYSLTWSLNFSTLLILKSKSFMLSQYKKSTYIDCLSYVLLQWIIIGIILKLKLK